MGRCIMTGGWSKGASCLVDSGGKNPRPAVQGALRSGGGCLSQHEAPVVLLHLQLNLCRVQLPVHPQDGESPGDAVLSLQTGGGRYPGHQRSRLLVEARDLRAHRKSRITNQRQSTSGVTRRMDWG